MLMYCMINLVIFLHLHLLCFFSSFKAGKMVWFCFFFFSSRRRHTRFKCDWSSDVCSSDLLPRFERLAKVEPSGFREAFESRQNITCRTHISRFFLHPDDFARVGMLVDGGGRSEERRVGKECRSRWAPYH